ncbi:MAG: glycosyltransferase, partial [Actinomycetota bacterium]|nr:glycosyltransferase [Actinomycetota bacterium]
MTSLGRAADRAGPPAPELIVVVNGPEGAAAADELLAASAGTVLRPVLVRLEDNTGFSGGANAGVLRATGEVLVVANLDLTFDEAFLENLNRYASKQDWDFLAPRVVQGQDGQETGVSRRRRSHTLAWVTP